MKMIFIALLFYIKAVFFDTGVLILNYLPIDWNFTCLFSRHLENVADSLNNKKIWLDSQIH